nr:homeodomain-interacting protein kinase 1-like [Nothobranchius furzeri]
MQALKCKKKIPGQKISREVQILKQVKSLNQDENHIVSLAGFADLGDWTCIALQKLDMNLLELMAQRNFKPLKLYEIRPIARQMFMALSALKAIKVVHTNIKPENVMLIDHNLQPFEVKLTGFGNAQKTRKLSTTAIPKTCGYSAPETFLNGFQDETMDVWSLGCMLAFLVLGQDLFPANSEYDYMRCITKILSLPPSRSEVDLSLLGLMHQRNMEPLSVHNIRAIAQQILVSLGALKEADSLGFSGIYIQPMMNYML